MPLTNAVQRGD